MVMLKEGFVGVVAVQQPKQQFIQIKSARQGRPFQRRGGPALLHRSEGRQRALARPTRQQRPEGQQYAPGAAAGFGRATAGAFGHEHQATVFAGEKIHQQTGFGKRPRVQHVGGLLLDFHGRIVPAFGVFRRRVGGGIILNAVEPQGVISPPRISGIDFRYTGRRRNAGRVTEPAIIKQSK